MRTAFWKQYEEKKAELFFEDDYVHVLNYYGFGGIGKTTLLKKLREELKERISAPQYVSYDFKTAIDLRTVLTSLKSDLVKDYQYEFPLFDIGLYIYAQKCGEKADPLEKQKLISSSSVLGLAFTVADNVPGVSVVTKILATIDEVTALGRTKAYLKEHKRIIKQLEYMEREEVYNKLPELFSKDLEKNLENATEPLVIFLDTYELLVNEMSTVGEPLIADQWLRGEDGPIQNVPKTLWVIAGREKLKWNRFNEAWDTAIDSHILGTLSEQDSTSFLQGAGITDGQLCKQLYELTNGTPVYLDLCVECFEELVEQGKRVHISQFGKNSYDLVERFVRYMDDTQKDMVYMTACLDKWDDDLFAAIAPQVLSKWSHTAYEKLKEYSFVNVLDNGCYSIHQTIGKVLLDQCLLSIKVDTANALIKHFSSVLKNVGIFSPEYPVALNYMMRAGLLPFKDRQNLCKFFEAEVADYFIDLIDAGKFEEAKAIFDMLLPEAEKCKDDLLYATVTRIRCAYFRSKGDYQTANVLLQETCDAFRKLFGEDHSRTLGVMGNMASNLSSLGNYEEAQRLLETVLEKQKKFLGEDHKDTLASKNNLALILYNLGKYEDALALQQEMLEKTRQIEGEDHPDTLTAMGNVATMLTDVGRCEEALEMEQELLKKNEQVFGKEHPATLVTINNLARVYYDLGMYEKALSLEEDLLEKRKRILGEEHPLTLSTISNMATTLAGLGRDEEALELNTELLQKRKQVLGETHPDTLTAINNLAIALSNVGRKEESLQLQTELLEKITATLGEDHPDTLSTMSNLATALAETGNCEEALKLAQTAADKCKVLLGEDSPQTLTAVNTVGLVLMYMGRLEKALTLNRELLEIRKRVLGEDHPDTLTTMNNMVAALLQTENYDEGLALGKSLLKKRREILGEEHPATLSTMHNIGSILYSLGRYEESMKQTKELLELRKRILGEDHPTTLMTMENLVATLVELGKPKELLELAQVVLEKEIQILGEDHPNTQRTSQLLDELKKN